MPATRACIVPGPYQLTVSPSFPVINAQSEIIPRARGPFTEQQFSSELPSRAWNTISWALALRTPSMGVL